MEMEVKENVLGFEDHFKEKNGGNLPLFGRIQILDCDLYCLSKNHQNMHYCCRDCSIIP